jgi:hypothetical protein
LFQISSLMPTGGGAEASFLWPVHNATLPGDVDGDGRLQPKDALLVVNFLNSAPDRHELYEGLFLDVDNDGSITNADAVAVLDRVGQVFRTLGGTVSPLGDSANAVGEAGEQQPLQQSSLDGEGEFLSQSSTGWTGSGTGWTGSGTGWTGSGTGWTGSGTGWGGPSNTAPTAYSGYVYTIHDQVTTGTFSGQDWDYDLLSISVSSSSLGSLSLGSPYQAPWDSSTTLVDYTFTPNPGATGSETLTLTVSDGEYSDDASVYVSVWNTVPEPSDDWAYTIHDQDATGNVAWNDGLMQNGSGWQDYDGDTVTFAVVDNVSNGNLTLDSATG